MNSPVLRAITETGQRWDDPSEALLFELLGDLERGQERFVIVERLSDASGHTYMQVLRVAGNAYSLEHREGSPDRHFGAPPVDRGVAHEVLTQWAYEIPGWEKRLAWKPLDLSAKAKSRPRRGLFRRTWRVT